MAELAEQLRSTNEIAGQRPGPPSRTGWREATPGLSAVQRTVDGSSRAASLLAVGAMMSARSPVCEAPIQRVLNNALPAGNFLKAAVAGYRADIDNSLQTIAANWRLLRSRYELLHRGGVALPHCAAYRTLATVDAPALNTALQGRFSDLKRQAFVNAYNRIRQREGANLFQQAETELAGFIDLDQIAYQPNSANRIIQDLEGRTDAAGGNRLFGGGAVARTTADRWSFTEPGPVVWTIHLASDPAPTGRIMTVVDAANHRIDIRIDRYPVPNQQKDVQERRIADAITFQFRQHGGGANSVFSVGVAAGPLGHTDNEKVETLRLIYRRFRAEEGTFDAAPGNLQRQVRMRQIVAQFDATVQEMNLDAAAKRNLFEQFPGLEANAADVGLGAKAAGHGIFHENRAQSMARDLGDTLADAGATGVRIITPELIEHMIAIKERNSVPEFTAMGLNGGHDTTRLQNFVHRHSSYALVPTGTHETDVMLGGRAHVLRVRVFRQYRWIGGGNPPDSLADRPPYNASAAQWAIANVPKTTVDDLFVFLQEGRAAYQAWRGANAAHLADASFGLVPGAPGHAEAAHGPSGIAFAGFVRPDVIASEPGRAIRKLDTLFVTA